MVLIVDIVLAVAMIGTSVVALITYVVTEGPLECKRPDYEKINRMEIELGIPPSNYSVHGVDSIGLLAAYADLKLRESERAIAAIDGELYPFRKAMMRDG